MRLGAINAQWFTPSNQIYSWFQTFAMLQMSYSSFFGWFPGIWILYADVSKHLVCSIFTGHVNKKKNWDGIARLIPVILLVHMTYEDETVFQNIGT
jgi:phage-related holin